MTNIKKIVKTSKDVLMLKDVETVAILKDLTSEFLYRRVYDPNNVKTNYFEVFYKNITAKIWNIKNGLLTSKYTAVKSHPIIKDIEENLNSIIENKKELCIGTMSQTTFTLKDVSTLVNHKVADKITLLMFQIGSGADIKGMDQKTSLSFTLLNSYGGESALQLNFGLLTQFRDKSGVVVKDIINNIILSTFKKKLNHKSSNKIQFSEIVKVKELIGKRVQLFKKCIITENVLNYLNDKLPIRVLKAMNSALEPLSEEYYNMYYLSYILSHIDANNKSTNSLSRSASINKIVNYIIEHPKEFIKK